MARIERLDYANVKKWIDDLSLESWTLLHDGGRRWDNMTSNMVEITNALLKGCRGLPITALVQLTFYRVNKYFSDRREKGEIRVSAGALWTTFIDAKVEGLKVKAVGHEVIMYHHRPGVFEVHTSRSRSMNQARGGCVQIVDLGERSCTCNKWRLFHYPCSHVMAACALRNIDYTPYIDPFYSIESYMRTWSPLFHPIRDRNQWPIYNGPTLIPDETLRRNKKGRPQTTRIHNEIDAREL